MKIAFDIQVLMKSEKTGIGWCADNILKNMSKNSKFKYELNCFTYGYSEKQLENLKKYLKIGYSINKCTWFHDSVYRIMWNFFYVPYSLFFGRNADITFFFNYVVPPGIKGKKVTIVHDMAYKAYPDTVRKKTKMLLQIALKRSCKRADKIVTISDFSKNEIIKYLGVKEEKIVVMPLGVDFARYHPDYTEKDVDIVKQQYKINRDYILYLGTLEPRKNLERLIQAYAKLKSEVSNIPLLVLAGKKGWMYEGIFETVKNLNVEHDVIFTGYVDETDAPILIKGARIFLFPSIYEGFGLPPLEAMACGTPVIVANVSSLPEVVGDAGILVEPMSVEGIKEGIKSLIEDEVLRREMSNRGLIRARNYSWDRAVEILQDIFEKISLET